MPRSLSAPAVAQEEVAVAGATYAYNSSASSTTPTAEQARQQAHEPPEALIPDSRLTRQETIDRGHEFMREGHGAENHSFFEDAVARFPDDPEIRLLYGIALIRVRPEDAPWQLATAIQLDPDDPSRLTRAATFLFHLGEIEAAREYAARAAQLAQPGFLFTPELLNLGGKLAALRGDDDLAEDALREATEIEPHTESFARDLAQYLEDHGRMTEALAVVDKALAHVTDSRKLATLREQLTSDPT